jgi:hypothetical protein
MMTTRTRIAALLLAAATLTTACGSTTQQAVPIGSADPFPGSSTAATTTTTAAAPSTSVSPADATGQAAAALTHYLDVFNRLVAGGDPAELSTVASGIEVTNANNDLAATRASGVRYVKGSQVLSSTVGAVNSSAVPATAQIIACISRGVEQGKTAPSGPAQRGTFYLTNPAWPDPSGWRVSDSDLRGQTCSA